MIWECYFIPLLFIEVSSQPKVMSYVFCILHSMPMLYNHFKWFFKYSIECLPYTYTVRLWYLVSTLTSNQVPKPRLPTGVWKDLHLKKSILESAKRNVTQRTTLTPFWSDFFIYLSKFNWCQLTLQGLWYVLKTLFLLHNCL